MLQKASPVGMAELSGDGDMAPFDRVRWLFRNAGRNLLGAFPSLPTERSGVGSEAACEARSWRGSPSRLVSDMVLRRELAAVFAGRSVSILDVGCGSGGARRHFADAGLSGTYLGVDIDDRFDREGVWPSLESQFVESDAHMADLPQADLVFSFSALEHIPEDRQLIERLRGVLQPRGIQMHVVPAGWALVAYLWHGYRHYHCGAIRARFDMERTRVIAIGGVGSLLLHTLYIAIPEMLLRVNLRSRMPGFYGLLVVLALKVDRVLPFWPTNYVVIERADEA
tara:strand:+ start:6063 stop:6908 length:846 start_codon:yes stop_codon:yes gene_type:complete